MHYYFRIKMRDKTDTSDVKVKGASLDKCHFYYGHEMRKQWVEINREFLKYVGARFGQSVRALLASGEIVITEVDEDLLPKFKTPEDKQNHLDGLEFWEQELCEQTKADYVKCSRIVRKDLSTAHGILFSIVDVSLRNKVEVESECTQMVEKKRFDAMMLYQLVKKNCHR